MWDYVPLNGLEVWPPLGLLRFGNVLHWFVMPSNPSCKGFLDFTGKVRMAKRGRSRSVHTIPRLKGGALKSSGGPALLLHILQKLPWARGKPTLQRQSSHVLSIYDSFPITVIFLAALYLLALPQPIPNSLRGIWDTCPETFHLGLRYSLQPPPCREGPNNSRLRPASLSLEILGKGEKKPC